MADKKDFKTDQNVTKPFLSSATDQPQADDYTAPEGYRLVPETKSARLQLLVPPRLREQIVDAARAEGLSINSFANKALQDYMDRREK